MLRSKFLSLGLVVWFSVSSMAFAQDNLEAVSQKFMSVAETALSNGAFEDAQVNFERALVADPANIQAMVGLGKAHEAAGRVGKGLRLYRMALEADPNHITALAAQSLAFLKVSEPVRASANLALLERLCVKGCSELAEVRDAIKSFNDLALAAPTSEAAAP